MSDNIALGTLFQDRTGPDGPYAVCFKNFTEDRDSLSQIDFIEDFIHETDAWPPGRYVTRFLRPSEPDKDLSVTLFGEVSDESEGTGLGARGGSASRNNLSESVDTSKIRDIIALRAPTGAGKELVELFNDQAVTLTRLVKEMPVPGKAGIPKRTQWVRPRRGDPDACIITVALPYKYSRPTAAAAPAKLRKRASDMDVGDSKANQISLESTYEPQRMADLDPKLNVGGVRLKQQPLYDENSNLVEPWKAPFVFRKGALVAIEATLSVYHFVEDQNPSHLYQITASGVKLSAPSPLEYKNPKPHPPPRKRPPSHSAMFQKMINSRAA